MENNINYSLTILLVAIFAVTFINIFFFTYGETIERQVVTDNVTYIANNISTTIKQFPEPYYSNMKEKINNTKLKNMDKEDNIVEIHNNTLMKTALWISGTIFCITMLVVISMYKYYNISNENMSIILINSIILVIGIGLVEFLFVTFVIKNYMIADMNKIKLHILNKFKNTK